MGVQSLRNMEDLSKVRMVFTALFWKLPAITHPSALFLGSWTLPPMNSWAGRDVRRDVGGRSAFGQMF